MMLRDEDELLSFHLREVLLLRQDLAPPCCRILHAKPSCSCVLYGSFRFAYQTHLQRHHVDDELGLFQKFVRLLEQRRYRFQEYPDDMEMNFLVRHLDVRVHPRLRRHLVLWNPVLKTDHVAQNLDEFDLDEHLTLVVALLLFEEGAHLDEVVDEQVGEELPQG